MVKDPDVYPIEMSLSMIDSGDIDEYVDLGE